MSLTAEKFIYFPKKEQISIQVVARRTNYQHKFVHMHDRNEMLFITSHSEATVFNNGNRRTVSTPALILHRAGSYHSTDTQSIDGTGYYSYCIFFNPQYVAQVPEALLHSRDLMSDDCIIIPLTTEQVEYYRTYLDLMKAEVGSNKKMLFLLLILLNETKRIMKQTGIIRLNNPNNYIFDITQYIMEHFDEPLKAHELAAEFHVSISKMNADFHKITNQTLKDFCTNLRINHAAHLLIDQDFPIAEIAYRCGFSSESYFIQSFQKHIGITPNAYRKSQKQD